MGRILKRFLGNSRGLLFLPDFLLYCPALSILPRSDYPVGTWLISLPSVSQLLITFTEIPETLYSSTASPCQLFLSSQVFPSLYILGNKVVHQFTCIPTFPTPYHSFLLFLCCQLVYSFVVNSMYPASFSSLELKFILTGKSCVLQKDLPENTTSITINTIIISYLAHPLHQAPC